MGMIIFSNQVISILYSSQFFGAGQLLGLHMLGAYVKLLVYPMGYVLLSRNKGWSVVILEFIWDLLYILIIYCSWNIFGLVSTAIGFVIATTVYLLMALFFIRKTIEFNWSKGNSKLIMLSLLAVGSVFIMTQIFNGMIIGFIIFIISALYSLRALNKIYPLKNILRSKLAKYFNS